jgi:hypothetical protein
VRLHPCQDFDLQNVRSGWTIQLVVTGQPDTMILYKGVVEPSFVTVVIGSLLLLSLLLLLSSFELKNFEPGV